MLFRSNTVVQAVSDGNNLKSVTSKSINASQSNAANSIEQSIEKESLKILFQFPTIARDWYKQINLESYTNSKYRELFELVKENNFGENLANKIHDETEDSDLKALVAELSVEEFKASIDKKYVDSIFARLIELNTARLIADLKSQLQRLEVGDNSKEHDRLFQELLELEEYRRALRDQALGTS